MSPDVWLPIAAALALLGCLLVTPLLGLGRMWFVGTLLTLAIPAPLIRLAEVNGNHFGITTAVPTIMTYTVPIVGLLLLKGRRDVVRAPLLLATVGSCYFFLMTFLVWGGEARQISGSLHLSLGLAAFVAGAKLSSTDRMRDWFFSAIIFMLAMQLAICAVQFAGVPLSLHGEVHLYLAEGRVIGTFNHPSTLGKFCLIVMIPLLAYTAHARSFMRRAAWFGVGASILLSGLTLARANTFGVILAVGLWLIVQRGSNLTLGRKALLTGVFAVVAYPAASAAFARFEVDAGGGRSHFMRVGLPFVSDNWLAGLGANSYVEVVGRVDAVTSAGYPIHNAALLLIAEVGVIGAVLAFAPPLAVVGLAALRLRAGGLTESWARAAIVTVPGLLLVALSGWGMVATSTFILWCLVSGVAWAPLCPHRRLIVDGKPATTQRAPFIGSKVSPGVDQDGPV